MASKTRSRVSHSRDGGPRLVDWSLVGGISAGVLALAGVAVVVALVLGFGSGGAPVHSPAPATLGPGYALPVELPPVAASPVHPGIAGEADAAWVRETARATGIPERALAAYAGAALFKARDRPDCGLGWPTLAALGLVESDHGRHGGSVVGDDGTVTPPIFGVPLTGESTAHIPDSDAGAIDGDTEFDRAVGPLQLIPDTWRNWHIDGNADGVEDPQNIDDAIVAAANYLCRASPEMVSEAGWRAGIGAYNASDVYVRSVADAANRYAADAASR